MNATGEFSEQVTLIDRAVGGVAALTDTLAILTHYLALAGLITVVSIVAAVRRGRV